MPAEFQPAIQAILSEIDFAHEHELEKVEKSAMDALVTLLLKVTVIVPADFVEVGRPTKAASDS